MKLTIARTAGFCMGVDMALRKLDLAIKAKDQRGSIFTLGPIIHNPQVLQHYADLGVRQTEKLEEIQPGDVVVIRAHGIPMQIQQAYEEHGARLVDATCPKVKKAQILIQKQAMQKKHLLLFGEPNHPEVQGLISYAQTYDIFETLDELRQFPLDTGTRYFLAAQTTQDKDLFDAIAGYLRSSIDPDLPILDTICTATKERQDEVRGIANKVQAMIVVGGKESGNTRRLAQIAEESGVRAIHVETSAELPLEELRQYESIGLTAGASTPSDIIADVANAIRKGR
jgi:4-hydroxy-3-methylbut-2-enyl diphosphate reductase